MRINSIEVSKYPVTFQPIVKFSGEVNPGWFTDIDTLSEHERTQLFLVAGMEVIMQLKEMYERNQY